VSLEYFCFFVLEFCTWNGSISTKKCSSQVYANPSKTDDFVYVHKNKKKFKKKKKNESVKVNLVEYI
jgi:hypothetical protein